MDRFQKACQASGPLVLEVEGAGEVRRHTFNQPFVRVGRSPKADLTLPHPAVSKKHAYFQIIAGHVFCVDAASRQGITWGGQARRYGWMRRGDAVGVGPYSVRLVGGDNPGSPAAAPPVPLPLEVDDGEGLTRWEMKRTLTLVGSRSPCGLMLADRTVSGVHASLVRAGDTLWIVDLFGRGGVQLNGRDVRCGQVGRGDEVRLGKYLIRLGAEATAAGTARAAAPPVPVSSPRAALAAGTALGSFEWAGPPALPPLPAGGAPPPTAEQMHQLLLTVHSYGALQREQMGVIMDELRRLGSMAREIEELKEVLERSLAPLAERKPLPQALEAPTPPPPSGPRTKEQEDVLRAVHRRLADIEEDRQTGWRKVLGMLQGAPKP